MINIIQLKQIKKEINKFDRKIILTKKESTKVDKILQKLDGFENIIKHLVSRCERINLRFLEE